MWCTRWYVSLPPQRKGDHSVTFGSSAQVFAAANIAVFWRKSIVPRFLPFFSDSTSSTLVSVVQFLAVLQSPHERTSEKVSIVSSSSLHLPNHHVTGKLFLLRSSRH